MELFGIFFDDPLVVGKVLSGSGTSHWLPASLPAHRFQLTRRRSIFARGFSTNKNSTTARTKLCARIPKTP